MANSQPSKRRRVAGIPRRLTDYDLEYLQKVLTRSHEVSEKFFTEAPQLKDWILALLRGYLACSGWLRQNSQESRGCLWRLVWAPPGATDKDLTISDKVGNDDVRAWVAQLHKDGQRVWIWLGPTKGTLVPIFPGIIEDWRPGRKVICLRCHKVECMDLLSFMERSRLEGLHLCEPGFSHCYVRKSWSQPSDSLEPRQTIELANLRAIQPGAGAFRRLLSRLVRRFPGRYVVVENVLTDRFAQGLARLGFQPLETRPERHLYLAT